MNTMGWIVVSAFIILMAVYLFIEDDNNGRPPKI